MSRRLRDRTTDLIRACELRRQKCETLRQKQKFAWGFAKTALEAHRKPIKTIAQLLKVKKIGSGIQEELIKILANTREVEPNAPTPGQLRTAASSHSQRSTGSWGRLA